MNPLDTKNPTADPTIDQTSSEARISKLEKDLKDLNEEVYRNNFSAQQDFNKKITFTTAMKVPHYDVLPTVGEVGEVIEKGGVLYICSSENTFTAV